MIRILYLLMAICLSTASFLPAQIELLPLVQIEDLEYQGGFRIPAADNGESNANYSTGTIAYNPANHSLYVAGFNLHGAIAEFAIPALVNSEDITQLNTASVLQDFRKILTPSSGNNPQSIDQITGMELIAGQLVVNAIEYYDAPADNTHTTLVIEDPADLTNSGIRGYYALEGAAHAAGWIAPLPEPWQEIFQGDYLCGSSSRYPINGRHVMGVSAFSFDASAFNNDLEDVPTNTLLDFDLTNPLFGDFSSYADANYNLEEVNGVTPPGHTFEEAQAIVGTNNLWTEESQASFGYIIPGSRSYLTIGSSGGHTSGIGYKPTQNNGNVCGGPCPYDAEDYYNYYWLWDANDLQAVMNGRLEPYNLRPYAYGPFDVPFQTDVYTNTEEFHPIVGGDYDPESGLLYLSIYDGAPIDNPFDRTPAIVVYKLWAEALVSTEDPIGVKKGTVVISPNPTSRYFDCKVTSGYLERHLIYDQLGQLLLESTDHKVDVSALGPGLYMVNTIIQDSQIVLNKIVVE